MGLLPLELLGREMLLIHGFYLHNEYEYHCMSLPDLEKKLQDLNQTKQDKAEQLRQLEEQVIAIKNEIMEQESKYATCKS